MKKRSITKLIALILILIVFTTGCGVTTKQVNNKVSGIQDAVKELVSESQTYIKNNKEETLPINNTDTATESASDDRNTEVILENNSFINNTKNEQPLDDTKNKVENKQDDIVNTEKVVQPITESIQEQPKQIGQKEEQINKPSEKIEEKQTKQVDSNPTNPVQPADTKKESTAKQPATTNGDQLVWIPTKGGKKYHKKASCSNMIDPDQVTLDEAISRGFDACKKCYK